MKFLLALESVMSRAERPLWLNAFVAAAALFAMAAIISACGLPHAGVFLTWLAILPLGFGVGGFAAGLRTALRTVHA